MPQWRIPNSKPWITHDDSEAVAYVLGSIAAGEYTLGYDVAAFEQDLAKFLGRRYVVCVSSGTVALELAYRARGYSSTVGAFGFIATANAAESAFPAMGIEFADCNLHEAPLGVTDGVGSETCIRDACQAFGAKLPASLADCYSFQFNKPVTTLGGGCVATDDARLADKVRALANQGRDSSPWALDAGTNGRMSDTAAALGRSQLRRADEILERRRTIAGWYAEMLPDNLNRQAPRDSWFLYEVNIEGRNIVWQTMRAGGVEVRSTECWLLPRHPAYRDRYGWKPGDFPVAERRADTGLLLPMYPELQREQVKEICDLLAALNPKQART